MARRKIRPEVLRPFLLAIALLVALFIFQFFRPIPPDIRQENLQKTYGANLQKLSTAVRQYHAEHQALPAAWPDLLKVGFAFETLELPDAEPPHPIVRQTPDGPQVENMPFTLLPVGPVDLAGPRKPLIEFRGGKEAPPAILYTDGAIGWVKRG